MSSLERAQQVVGLGAAHVVVGLETLHSYQALAQICEALGDRVAFSLDLRDGEPIVAADGIASGEPPHVVAARATDTGIGAIIVIDLARVGASAGLDLDLIARVRTAAPGLMLVAGGGVHGPEDLTRLADEGCDGALVATALLEGRIGAAEVAATRQFNRRFDRQCPGRVICCINLGARRPVGKARGARISGIFERRATPPASGSPTRHPRWGGGGMPRPGVM